MSRHIHDPCDGPIRKFESGKPDVDGHTALLLLFEPVRIGSCQRLDQGRLTMIDMPGGSNDNVFHKTIHHQDTKTPRGNPPPTQGREVEKLSVSYYDCSENLLD